MMFTTPEQAFNHLAKRIPNFSKIAETRFKANGWTYMDDAGDEYIPDAYTLESSLRRSLMSAMQYWFQNEEKEVSVFTCESGRFKVGVERCQDGLWNPILEVQATPNAFDRINVRAGLAGDARLS